MPVQVENTSVQLKPRNDESIWYGPEIVKRTKDWIFYFTPSELQELLNGAKEIKILNDQFLDFESLEQKSFLYRFPLLTKKLEHFLEILQKKHGFVLLKGFPVNEVDRATSAAAFLIIGKLMGNLRQQNAKGHLLGHVTDLGVQSKDPNIRIYQTRERQTFHTDSCDIVGLLCLKTAKSGGLSALVSSGTIYNEMLSVDPELTAELFKSIATDKRGEIAKGTEEFFDIPVYTMVDNHLTCMYQRQYIDSSQRFPNAPRLTEKQVKALDLFDSLADDPRLHFTMELAPGDMQFVYNHTLLHDRTGFVDWDLQDIEKKRHLLRMWISPRDGERPLDQRFADQFGTVEPGNRGGIGLANEGIKSIAPLHPTNQNNNYVK